jgi:D-cysteine desulfhydrase
VKRDDLTGFGLSGNKVRKLEYHLAAAVDSGADTVVTCGAAQSNHCRTTAIACARLGLRAVLLLRTPDGLDPGTPAGNHLLDLMTGAECRYVTPVGYRHRDEIMADLAVEVAVAGGRPWVIPEGASDAVGMWGFVAAMEELASQLDEVLPGVPVTVWHAASSGATTAGLGWAIDGGTLPHRLVASSVGDSVGDLQRRVDTIWAGAALATGTAPPCPAMELVDDHVGLGYSQVTLEEWETQLEVTRLTGLVLDPTYTGKAIHGLRVEVAAGRFTGDDHVVFWHTGGGFAPFAAEIPLAVLHRP